MGTGRTMQWALVGDMQVVFHAPGVPEPGEWQEYCEALRDTEMRGIIVFSDPDFRGPDAAMRRRAADVWANKGYTVPVAMFTRSIVLRGVLTALKWVTGARMRCFTPEDVAGAVAYLGVDDQHREAILKKASELAAEVGGRFICAA